MATSQSRSGTRIFFYLVYLFLAGAWYGSMAFPQWRPLSVLFPFTALTLLHGFLHGLTERAAEKGWGVAYLVSQSLLAVGMVVLAGESVLTEAIFAPIAGEAVGLFPRRQGRVLAVLGVTGAWALAAGLTGGFASVGLKLPWVLVAFGFAIVYVLLFQRQASERARAEALLGQLEEAHGQLRVYARQVEELTITEERHRMARELHDTLAQGLVGLIMQLEAVDDLLLRGEPDRGRQVVRKALDRTRQSLAEARATISALRRPLEREELVEAIGRELDRVRADGGLQAMLELGPGEVVVDGAVALQLYRIAQEGLNNVLRHARATRVMLRLWCEEGWVHLWITDDGVGFDPAGATGQVGHFGLTGIGERVRLAGGRLQIDSRPGQGTRLQIALPVQMPGEEGAL